MQLALTEKQAARALALTLEDFRRLRSAGVLPRPIAALERQDILRWSVEELQAVLKGKKLEMDW